MHRRDFFRSKGLVKTAARVLGLAHEMSAALNQPAAVDAVLTRYARRAMATIFEIILPLGTSGATQAAEAGLELIDQLEAQLTVYREDSEVSAINRNAAERPVPVEERLFELFREAERLTISTEGAFDIAVGALIKSWGFFRRQGRVPAPQERAQVLSRCGMQHVGLDAEARTVSFDCLGVELNLGSIGKGYALDRAVELLVSEYGVTSGLVHGGRSSIFALGNEPGGRRGWAVGIRHPVHTERRLAIVRLYNRALGTSASTNQHFVHEGRRLGHILDPRRGWPAEGMLSASVLAPSAAEADALATAFFVLGVDKAREYCAAHPQIGAVLLPEGPPHRPVILNVPDDDIAMA